MDRGGRNEILRIFLKLYSTFNDNFNQNGVDKETYLKNNKIYKKISGETCSLKSHFKLFHILCIHI